FAATIVFQKDFPIGQANKNEQQQFIEYVPFDEVLSKVMKRGNATRILAVNKQLYEMFKRACEDLQCTVVGVVAYPMLSEITPELLQTVDLPLILSKFDTFKQMSLVSATSTQIPSFAPEQMPEKSRRLPLLLGVFGLLMFILVAVIFISFSSNKPSAVVVKRLPPPVVTAAPVINQATESGETIPVSSGVQGVATGPASIFPKMGY
ncbi:MAG TPA: hypothetical protein VLF68_04215, partial [Candidatus Saccharimonadales bacterium]|nr:hypothetical protein [Candidatus Saccharimonadales bacterium]